MTSTLVGSNHSILTQASSHLSSWEHSKMWHTGSVRESPLQPFYFIDHFPYNHFSFSALFSLHSGFSRWQTLLKGRQQVRTAPVATMPPTFFLQAHDRASCVWGGVRGISAKLPSAAAGLGFSSLGGEKGALISLLMLYFFSLLSCPRAECLSAHAVRIITPKSQIARNPFHH